MRYKTSIFYPHFIFLNRKGFSLYTILFHSDNSKLFHVKHYPDSKQEELLVEFLSSNGVSLSENILEKLFEYVNLVILGNEKVNLISRNDIPKFLTRHIADSLFPFIVLSKTNFLKPGMIWADMGAGGGCPVYPLAIACPDIQFYASEPRHKRVLFYVAVRMRKIEYPDKEHSQD